MTQCHGYNNMLTSDRLPCDVTLVEGDFLSLIRRHFNDRNHLETIIWREHGGGLMSCTRVYHLVTNEMLFL